MRTPLMSLTTVLWKWKVMAYLQMSFQDFRISCGATHCPAGADVCRFQANIDDEERRSGQDGNPHCINSGDDGQQEGLIGSRGCLWVC